jgi:hypothetical protein
VPQGLRDAPRACTQLLLRSGGRPDLTDQRPGFIDRLSPRIGDEGRVASIAFNGRFDVRDRRHVSGFG